MSGTNDFQPFAVASGANVLTQAAYLALPALSTGYQSGVAQSAALNKTWRQSSIIAALIAQLIVDQTGQNATDDGTIATLETNLVTAIRNIVRQKSVLTDTGTANTYTAVNSPALTALPSSGFVQVVSIAHTNTGASTYSPDGLTAKPIYGLGLSALQGNELVANGVATLMYLIAPGVNSGNGAWIIIECTGGSQQVAPAIASNQAAQLGQVQNGTIGSSRNLHATQTAAASTLTISADQTIVASSLSGTQYAISNWSLTLNIGTVGAGGIDTGSAPTFSNLAIYLIYNPTTQTAALLATLANTIIAPTIYNAGHMPSGYTASALISVWPTDGGARLIAATQIDRSIYRPAVTAFTTTTNAISPTSQVISVAVPPNARSFGGYVSFSNTTSNVSSSMVIGSDANMSGAKSTNYVNPSGSATGGQNFDNIAMFTPQTIYFTSGNTSGTTTYTVSCTVYTI